MLARSYNLPPIRLVHKFDIFANLYNGTRSTFFDGTA